MLLSLDFQDYEAPAKTVLSGCRRLNAGSASDKVKAGGRQPELGPAIPASCQEEGKISLQKFQATAEGSSASED